MAADRSRPAPPASAERAELVDATSAAARSAAEPPVVARLVIELRSDGRTTIARGAMEDLVGGESVAIEARAGSPLELSLSLARALFQAPIFASTAARGALPSAADLRAGARDRIGRIAGRLRRRLHPTSDPPKGER